MEDPKTMQESFCKMVSGFKKPVQREKRTSQVFSQAPAKTNIPMGLQSHIYNSGISVHPVFAPEQVRWQ